MYVLWLVVQSLRDPQGSRLVDVVGFPVEFLSLKDHNPSSYCSVRVSKVHLLFGCGCLHLSESATVWSLVEGSHARLLSVSIIKYH